MAGGGGCTEAMAEIVPLNLLFVFLSGAIRRLQHVSV